MSDLIKRLRDSGDDPLENYKMCDEAADRIEALENVLREIANLDPKFSSAVNIAQAALAPEKNT